MTETSPTPPQSEDNTTTINEWADQRGFRPTIPFDEACSSIYHRRFSNVPGLYIILLTGGDIFVGMSNSLGDTMREQPSEWQKEITGVRLMARSKTGLALVPDAMKLQREATEKGLPLHPRPHRSSN